MNWEKIRKYSQKAGQEMVAVAEATYMTFKDPSVSYRHKAVLVGALVYLLSPLDGIPDMLPGGLADDMSILLAALYSTGVIGSEHLKKAREKRGLTSKKDDDKNGSTEETSSQ